MSLRKRIADSPRFNNAVAWLFATYIRWVHRTCDWTTDGWPAVEQALHEHGAVIIVGWHQRLLMSPYMFDAARYPCNSLTADRRAGKLAGLIHTQFGYTTTPMGSRKKGARAMRVVLKGLRDGVSIAIAADGPQGPARASKTTPILWARSSGKPVFVFAFSTRRFWRWPTWDRMMFSFPFSKGVMLWREWDRDVPRTLSNEGLEQTAAELSAFADEVTAQADLRAGHSGPQT